MILRPYQQHAIDEVRSAFRTGARAPLLVAPTGAGKTVILSYVSRGAAERGGQVLILVHRRELIRQTSDKLRQTGVPHGIIAPGFTGNRLQVQVASVQTIARRLATQRHDPPSLIIADEAHHAVAGQWKAVIDAYPSAKLLGVTATPQRLDGRGLGVDAGGMFDRLVLGPTVASLVANGHLTPCRIFAPAQAPELSGIRTKGGDFDAQALADAMSKPQITGDAVAHYRRHAAGLPTILFSPSVAHAEMMAEQFRKDGWRAVAVSGASDMGVRDRAIGGLATGETQILCTCDLISEGLDVPVVGAVILLRPTKSLGLHIQQVGRGLRPAPGKTALLVLDHAGNTLRHGVPETEREWTLDGRVRRKAKKDDAPSVRQCPRCFAMHEPAPQCPECGHTYEVKAREIEHVDGILAELSSERLGELRTKPTRELQRQARTRDDLMLIAKAKGFRPGWVDQVMKHRGMR